MSSVIEKELISMAVGSVGHTALEATKKIFFATTAAMVTTVAVTAIQAVCNPSHYYISKKPCLVTQVPEEFPGKTMRERCGFSFEFSYYLSQNAAVLLHPVTYLCFDVLGMKIAGF